jgi:hypothetical protein
VSRIEQANAHMMAVLRGEKDHNGTVPPPPPEPTVTPPTAPAGVAEAKPGDALDDLFEPTFDDGSERPMSGAEYAAFVKAEEAKLASLPKRSATEIQATISKRKIAI